MDTPKFIADCDILDEQAKALLKPVDHDAQQWLGRSHHRGPLNHLHVEQLVTESLGIALRCIDFELRWKGLQEKALRFWSSYCLDAKRDVLLESEITRGKFTWPHDTTDMVKTRNEEALKAARGATGKWHNWVGHVRKSENNTEAAQASELAAIDRKETAQREHYIAQRRQQREQADRDTFDGYRDLESQYRDFLLHIGTTLGSPMRFGERAARLKKAVKRDLKDIESRVEAAKKGLVQIYGIKQALPNWGEIESAIYTLYEWLQNVLRSLLEFGLRDQHFVRTVSLRRLLSSEAWAGFKQNGLAEVEIPNTWFETRYYLRLHGVNVTTVLDNPQSTSVYRATIDLPDVAPSHQLNSQGGNHQEKGISGPPRHT